MRRPGIEPGSTAWKAAMLTIIPPTLYGYVDDVSCVIDIVIVKFRGSCVIVIVIVKCYEFLPFSPLEDSALKQA